MHWHKDSNETSVIRNSQPLNMRKLFMVSVLRRHEKLQLHDMVEDLAISNTGLNMAFSKACPGWTVRLLGGDDRGFLKEGVMTYQMALMLPLNLPIINPSSSL